MIIGDSALASALSELATLGSGSYREQIAALRARLDAARLRVLVVGDVKRGKSTLVNALLGRELLPTGVTPLTCVATTLRYGDDPRAEVRFLDGHEEKHPLDALPDLVTERGNAGNRHGISAVLAYLDAPVLAGGVELVDAPGTGSLLESGTEAAHQELAAMDAAVFVLSADSLVSASERDLLTKVAASPVTVFAVLNKADRLDQAGLAEAMEFTRRMLAAAGTVDDPAAGRLYPVSASAGLAGGDPGFAEFARDFTTYLATRRTAELHRSASAQARRIASSLLYEAALTRRAAQLRGRAAAEQADRFAATLAAAAVGSRDAVAAVNAESARLLFALNDSVDEAAPTLSRDVARQLEAALGHDLRGAPPDEIERQGGDLLSAFTRQAVAGWRDQRAAAIEQGLAGVDSRLAADLTAGLTVLRDRAAELLGADLAVSEPGPRLTGGQPLLGSTAGPAARPERPTAAVPRGLPGELGRWRARERLRREVENLVSREIDRARTDLQDRLAQATRTLALAAGQHYADGAEQMDGGLQAAARLREDSAAGTRREEQRLDKREAALRHVLALLDRAAGSGGGLSAR